MVCTNLASRGLDTMKVDHVIQFEFAKNVVDFIHRVGRTGRMGQMGLVTSFIRKSDQELEKSIRDCMDKGDSFDNMILGKKIPFSGQKKKKSDTDDFDSE